MNSNEVNVGQVGGVDSAKAVDQLICYVIVSGQATHELDGGLDGVYMMEVHANESIFIDLLTENEKSTIAKLVKDEFHDRVAIKVLDDFEISLRLSNGKYVSEDYENDECDDDLIRCVEFCGKLNDSDIPAWLTDLQDQGDVQEGSDQFAKSDQIKTEYLDSGCQASDVDYAVQRLMNECQGIFQDDRAAWSFLMEETHEEKEPEADDEIVVKLADGCTLRSGVDDPDAEGALTAGDYVRLCGPDGEEIHYWSKDEWEADPALVMGAILIAAAGNRLKPSVENADSHCLGM